MTINVSLGGALIKLFYSATHGRQNPAHAESLLSQQGLVTVCGIVEEPIESFVLSSTDDLVRLCFVDERPVIKEQLTALMVRLAADDGDELPRHAGSAHLRTYVTYSLMLLVIAAVLAGITIFGRSRGSEEAVLHNTGDTQHNQWHGEASEYAGSATLHAVAPYTFERSGQGNANNGPASGLVVLGLEAGTEFLAHVTSQVSGRDNGRVMAIVDEDVYDSIGISNKPAIPRGTIMVGNKVGIGSPPVRMTAIVWTEMELPDAREQKIFDTDDYIGSMVSDVKGPPLVTLDFSPENGKNIILLVNHSFAIEVWDF